MVSFREWVAKAKKAIASKPARAKRVANIYQTHEKGPDLARLANKTLKLRVAQVEGTNSILQGEIDELLQQARDKKKQVKVLQAAGAHAQRRKQADKRSSVLFRLDDRVKPPVFILKSGRSLNSKIPQYLFYGFEMKETDDGNIVFYPLLCGKNKKQPVRFRAAALSLKEMFTNDGQGLVSQIRAGLIQTNFEYLKNGAPVLLSESLYAVSGDRKTKVINISQSERSALEQAAAFWQDKYQEQGQQITQLIEREEGHVVKINELDADVTRWKKQRDEYAATCTAFSENSVELIKLMTEGMQTIQHARTGQVLSDALANELMDWMKELQAKAVERLPRGEREAVRAETQEEFVQMLNSMKGKGTEEEPAPGK